MSWLRDWVALPQTVTGDELAQALVRAGLEVETVEKVGEGCGNVVAGARVEPGDPAAVRRQARHRLNADAIVEAAAELFL